MQINLCRYSRQLSEVLVSGKPVLNVVCNDIQSIKTYLTVFVCCGEVVAPLMAEIGMSRQEIRSFSLLWLTSTEKIR
jgi:hypothetical protein